LVPSGAVEVTVHAPPLGKVLWVRLSLPKERQPELRPSTDCQLSETVIEFTVLVDLSAGPKVTPCKVIDDTASRVEVLTIVWLSGRWVSVVDCSSPSLMPFAPSPAAPPTAD